MDANTADASTPAAATPSPAQPATNIDNGLFVIPDPHWLRHGGFPAQQLDHRKRTIRLLSEDPSDTVSQGIGTEIRHCRKSRPCGSPFCPFCRSFLQDTATGIAHRTFGPLPMSDIAFLTILLPVTYTPFTDAPQQIKTCRKQIHNLIANNGFGSMRLFGAFEIDVKHPKKIAGRKRSEDVLKALGMNLLNPDCAYLVHLHALVDLGGRTRSDVRKAFTRIFSGPYQVRLTHLDSNNSQADNLEQIARYMFKFRTQHADNLFGKDIGHKARYGSFFDGELLRTYVRLLHRLKGNSPIRTLCINKNTT